RRRCTGRVATSAASSASRCRKPWMGSRRRSITWAVERGESGTDGTWRDLAMMAGSRQRTAAGLRRSAALLAVAKQLVELVDDARKRLRQRAVLGRHLAALERDAHQLEVGRVEVALALAGVGNDPVATALANDRHALFDQGGNVAEDGPLRNVEAR